MGPRLEEEAMPSFSEVLPTAIDAVWPPEPYHGGGASAGTAISKGGPLVLPSFPAAQLLGYLLSEVWQRFYGRRF